MHETTLQSHLLPGSNVTYYIPDFVTKEEETYLLRKETPKQKWRQLANRRLQTWGGELTPKNALIPDALPPFLSEFPDIISRIEATGVFADSPHHRPNHVILNEYHPGQGIMPHEDGPSYHPVVATLSLGSHTVMHYYQYTPSVSPDDGQHGRTIDTRPSLSLLLEPRSLVITTSALYTDHLHGISEVGEDHLIAHDGGRNDGETVGIRVANYEMIKGEDEKKVVMHGGTLRRQTRYSLTCRDVGKVVSIRPGVARK